MNPRQRLVLFAERHCFTLVGLLIAWLVKRHYSQASPEELRWMLAPTAWLTALVLDSELTFRAGEGYLSRELSILISPACAGINFAIIAFSALMLGFSSRFRTVGQRAGWLLGCLALAYVTTLLVNTVRISLSVAGAHLAARTLGLTFQSVHRLLGIVVYVAGLVVLCLTVQLWLSSRGQGPGKCAVLLLALGCYAAVTLLIPLLHGGALSPEYLRHAAPVSVLVGGLSALLFAARRRTWDDGRHEFRSSEHP